MLLHNAPSAGRCLVVETVWRSRYEWDRVYMSRRCSSLEVTSCHRSVKQGHPKQSLMMALSKTRGAPQVSPQIRTCSSLEPHRWLLASQDRVWLFGRERERDIYIYIYIYSYYIYDICRYVSLYIYIERERKRYRCRSYSCRRRAWGSQARCDEETLVRVVSPIVLPCSHFPWVVAGKLI